MRKYLGSIAICGLALAAACSKNASPPPATGDGSGVDVAAQRAPRVLTPPGEEPAPGAGVAASGPLAWDVPAGWIEETPASNMRRAQYRVPGPGGDGECIVFYFGPGQGGDPASNAIRWAGQFRQPDGRPSADVMKVERLDRTDVPVQIVEVTGTYDGGMTMTDAPAEQREDHMLLGGIAESSVGPWFFKFTGPEATVRAQSEPFERMMRSLRPGV